MARAGARDHSSSTTATNPSDPQDDSSAGQGTNISAQHATGATSTSGARDLSIHGAPSAAAHHTADANLSWGSGTPCSRSTWTATAVVPRAVGTQRPTSGGHGAGHLQLAPGDRPLEPASADKGDDRASPTGAKGSKPADRRRGWASPNRAVDTSGRAEQEKRGARKSWRLQPVLRRHAGDRDGRRSLWPYKKTAFRGNGDKKEKGGY